MFRAMRGTSHTLNRKYHPAAGAFSQERGQPRLSCNQQIADCAWLICNLKSL